MEFGIDKKELTPTLVARLPKLWRGYSAFCGEVTKSVARLPVARLPCGEVTVRLQVTVQYFVGISHISTTFWFQ